MANCRKNIAILAWFNGQRNIDLIDFFPRQNGAGRRAARRNISRLRLRGRELQIQ